MGSASSWLAFVIFFFVCFLIWTSQRTHLATMSIGLHSEPLASVNPAELKIAFRSWSGRLDGRLDEQRFKNMLFTGNKDLTNREVNALFKSCDQNHTGWINFDEFIDFIHTVPSAPEAPRASEAPSAAEAPSVPESPSASE